jgi:hypothetical protein
MSTADAIKEVLHHPIYSALSSLPVPLPQTFVKWQVGKSPFSTHAEVVSALAVYLAVIFGGQWLMRDRKPFRKFASPGARARGCVRWQIEVRSAPARVEAHASSLSVLKT